MNKQQFYTFGSALLATSALATTAMAGSIGTKNTAYTSTTTSKVLIANTLFASTASTANALVFGTKDNFVISFANNFAPSSKFGVEIDITGAKFNTAVQPNVTILTRATSGATFTGSQVATGLANCALQTLADKIVLDNCQVSGFVGGASSFAGGIELSGVLFSGGAALATAGSTIQLTAFVYNGNNPTQHFEDILTPATIITSTVPFVGQVVQTTTVTADPLTSPTAFTALSSPSASAASLSVTIATVILTSMGALNTDLSTAAKIGDAVSSAAISISSGVLSSASTTTVTLAADKSTAFAVTVTTAAFSGGVLTFSVNSVSAVNTFLITAQFDGKNAISQVATNSTGISVTYGIPENTASNTTIAAVSGPTVAISRGGFSGQANTFFSSANSGFASFIRIHNNGATAGVATISVLNDTTGAALGSSYSTPSIPAGATLQISAKDIETGAGITASSSVGYYTVNVTGPIIGYIQHLIFNQNTGQLADLSSFRNANSTSGNP